MRACASPARAVAVPLALCALAQRKSRAQTGEWRDQVACTSRKRKGVCRALSPHREADDCGSSLSGAGHAPLS